MSRPPTETAAAAGRPYCLQVELTSRCNLRCKMCPLTLGSTLSSAGPGDMEAVVWDRFVAYAREVAVVGIVGYGEPTLNPLFVPVLRELDDLEVKTCFSTNGIAVTPELVAKAAALRHLSRVNVSIDSPDPDVYRAVRGGNLSRAVRGLRLLREGLPARVEVTVSSVAMRTTLPTLAAFPQLLAEVGVTTYVVQGMYDVTGSTLDLEHLYHQTLAADVVRDLRAACRAAGVNLVLQPDRHELELTDPAEARRRFHADADFTGGRTRQCLAPWHVPYVDKNGTVFPCCHGDGSAVMGSLREHTLAEVWDGPRFRAFRTALLGGPPPGVCRRCPQVPVGVHPLALFAAELLPAESRLEGAGRLRLAARNTGRAAWTADAPVWVGTYGDRASRHRHPSWPAAQRVCRPAAARVGPGEVAVFEFRATPAEGAPAEAFQLVAGDVWLPGTQFAIRPTEPRARVPNFFSFVYAGEPHPGKRLWLRLGRRTWVERRPDGYEERYRVVRRTTVGGARGVVARRAGDPAAGVEVFIPDVGTAHPHVWSRLTANGGGAWAALAAMTGVE